MFIGVKSSIDDAAEARSSRCAGALFAGCALLLLAALFPVSAAAVPYNLDPIHPSFCSKGSAANQCETSINGVAVDQANGKVYVVDVGNARIAAFDPGGNFLWAAGWKVRVDAPAEAPQVCTIATGCQKGTQVAGSDVLGKITAGARGIAVDPVTHIVYVAVNPSRVKYFDGTSGEFLGEMSGVAGVNSAGTSMPPSPAAPNEFFLINGIAVDISDAAQHYLYLVAGNTAIDKFKVPIVAAGTLATQASYVCQITGKEAPSASECHGSASKDGAFDGISFVADPVGKAAGNLAVDSVGNVIFAEEEVRNTVSVFDSSGAFVKQCTVNKPEALAVGESDHVFVSVEGKASNAGGTKVREYDFANSCAVGKTNFGSGVIGNGSSNGGALGLAVDHSGGPNDGHVLVGDSSSNAKVWNFEIGVGGPPIVEEEREEEVTGFSAKLIAKINPNNVGVSSAEETFPPAKDCEFQYTTDPGFATDDIQSVPCQDPGDLGSGAAGVETRSTITGLMGDTTYYWRATAANSEADEATPGAIESFTTKNSRPTATTDAAGAVTAATAVLNGHVDNHGAPAGSDCEFRVAAAANTGFAEPVKTFPCLPSPVTGSGSVATTATASGLSANTSYVYRVIASNEGNKAGEKSLGGPQPFITTGRPVVQQSAVEVSETTAKLGATVDPAGLPTTYHLEYVDDAAYRADQPSGFEHATKTAESGTIGSGHGAVAVPAKELEGLEPSTTYHYRFLAQNSNGPSAGERSFTTRGPLPGCANQTLREENNSTLLADCRAYELVSPAEKNFGGVDGSAQPLATAGQSGEAVAFCTDATFGEPPAMNGKACIDYVSQRKVGGWATRALVPSFCGRDLGEGTVNVNVFGQAASLSPNLDFAAIGRPEAERPAPGQSCEALPPLLPGAPELGKNLYRADLSADPASYALLAPAPAFEPSYNQFTANYKAASDDYSHIAYQSSGQQAPGALGGGVRAVFEWSEGGVSLVSRAPGTDAPLSGPSSVPRDAVNGVSADGSRVFFENPVASNGQLCSPGVPTCNVYLREGGASYDVSESECTAACGPSAAAIFEWATPSGDKALFRSAEKLVDADHSSGGEDLYLFTKGPDPEAEGDNLTLLSQDKEPGDGDEAGVLGVVGISDDGDTVYFAASGQIVEGEPTAAGPKVYRWSFDGGSPKVEYLARLGTGTSSLGDPNVYNWNEEEAGSHSYSEPASGRVTADGRTLLVQTTRPLDPIADTDADLDVYRWNEEEGWDCLSCQAPGEPSKGESTLASKRLKLPGSKENGNISRQNGELRVKMSADGGTVAFSSYDPLVPADANDLLDVYEWHEGTVNLVSSGASGTEGGLIAISGSGRDIFFYARQRLNGWDTDSASDIYDARAGGGFKVPAVVMPCDPNTSCKGPGTADGNSQAPGSASLQGPGNPTPPTSCKKGFVRKGGKCVKKHKKHRAKKHKHKKHHSKQAGHKRGARR